MPVPVTIDQLRYAYRGNQLVGVDDYVASAVTHDFEDVALYDGVNDEYTYDENGNLIKDVNKSITAITYNHLNLPELITFTLGRSIRFVYTADGSKLAKHVSRPGAKGMVITNTTAYASGFVYTDNRLAFAPMPEGRLIYTPTPSPAPTQPFHNWKHEYHLKDHLGNLRYAFRDEGGNTLQRSTSMEPANADTEEKQFERLAETRQRDAVHARTGEYVARLNAREGRRQGPGVRLAVSAGDSIRTEVYARYDHSRGAIIRAGALAIGAAMGSPFMPLETGGPKGGTTTAKRRFPFIGLGVAAVPQLLRPGKKGALPGAMLRLELFDQDSQLVRVLTQPMQRTATDEWQRMQTGLVADSSGYVVASLVNETGITAYFDDLALRIVDPQEVQENHYDPWGLNLVGIEDVGNPDSKFQYNGKEKQEDFGLNVNATKFRVLDAQLGRWWQNDPIADKSSNHSPYSFVMNNPIRYSDPTGLDTLSEVVVVGRRMQAAVENKVNWFTGRDVNYQGSGWGHGPRRALANASGLGSEANNLIELGLQSQFQAAKVSLTGSLLDKVKNDPGMAAFNAKMIKMVKSDPRFGKINFAFKQRDIVGFGGKREGGDKWTELSLDNPILKESTWDVAGNPLTWAVRNATISADATVKADGTIVVDYSLHDTFDLSGQTGRSSAYNFISNTTGFLYHDLTGGNKDLEVNANWQQTYSADE